MKIIESSFEGRRATVDAVTAFLNRHLPNTPIDRVELRFSTQSAVPFDGRHAQDSIVKFMREHGQTQAKVSVRPHSNALEDAMGVHDLRLVPLSATPDKPDAVDTPELTLKGLIERLRRALTPGLADDGKAVTTGGNASGAPSPAMGTREALIALREATKLAATRRSLGAATGRATESDQGEQEVAHAQIVVRLHELHEALGGVIGGNLQVAAGFISNLLQTLGVAVSPRLTVSYAQLTRSRGDGTTFVSESDLEVVLRCEPPKFEAGDTLLPKKDASHKQADGTYLFQKNRPLPWGVRMVVLGTSQSLFPEPFDLGFHTLPALFNRNLLEERGFAKSHPELLGVASNRSPLSVLEAGPDHLKLEAQTRSANGQDHVPMYFSHDQQPLIGPQCFSQKSACLLVNDPRGVAPAGGGQIQPALLVMLDAALPTENT